MAEGLLSGAAMRGAGASASATLDKYIWCRACTQLLRLKVVAHSYAHVCPFDRPMALPHVGYCVDTVCGARARVRVPRGVRGCFCVHLSLLVAYSTSGQSNIFNIEPTYIYILYIYIH